MQLLKTGILILICSVLLICCNNENQNSTTFNSKEMMIRIAEIEIDPNYLDDYLAILKVESKASIRLEKGVIAIYPMFQKEFPNEIRLLEIYESKAAYESHLQTSHFKEYKSSTLHMVKSLKLIEMEAIDEVSMPKIFIKLKK